MITFNVIFTRGSAARLLPFGLSLLQSPDVALRLVANGCDTDEVDLLRAVAAREERITHHVLPYTRTVEHGAALNNLFEAFEEERFAFVDSDVIAAGDFLAPLRDVVPGQAAAFTAPAVWMAPGEVDGTRKHQVLSGGRRMLNDGTYAGNTFCAIYERKVLEPTWREAPRGFAVHHDYLLDPSLKERLAERGWHYRTYDTARLLNLLLLLHGFTLEERHAPLLHHVGGASIREFYGAVGKLRRLDALRSGPRGRLRRLADGAIAYVRFKRLTDPTLRRRRRRKELVLAYVDVVLDAIIAGDPVPPAPRTDLPEVDRRLKELVATLETEYPRGLAAVRQVSAALASKPVAA